MSETACAFNKPDGDPCAAHALPNSVFCMFHDPDHAEARAAGRSKGGSVPRRARRFPRILDHVHVAEIMGELLIDALNEPVLLDNKRLHALTHLCQVLLKAVGTPKDSFLAHHPHAEPPATEEHLLRLYTTLSSAIRTALPTDAPTGADLEPPSSGPEHRTPNTQYLNTEPTPTTPSGEHTLTVCNAPAYQDHACLLNREAPSIASSEEYQAPEQENNKLSTSGPGTTTPPASLPTGGDRFPLDFIDGRVASSAGSFPAAPFLEIAAPPRSVDPSPLIPELAPAPCPAALSPSPDPPIAPPPVAPAAGEPVSRYSTFGPLRS
jgi:hypothetical protein